MISTLRSCNRASRRTAVQMGRPIVELRDVSLSFGEKPVLNHVSLRVEPQERLVIIGQSGAGKTTILRLILGVLQPTEGAVFFDRFEIPRLTPSELQRIRTRIGMIRWN